MEEKTVYFNIQDLLPIALVFVVTGIVIAYGLQILGDVRTDMVTNTASCGRNSTGGTGGTILYTGCDSDYNATGQAVTAVAKFPAKLGLIATVVIAAVLIGILIRYLAPRAMGR